MNKFFIIIPALLIIFFMPPMVSFADSGMNQMRRQADSQFRIAEKAYRKAVKDYGESLEGFPAEEKTSACKKMSSALHDNRTQYRMEDVLSQMKYKKQVKKLEDYSSSLGCSN